MPTIFEKIMAREIPAHIVYEDDKVIAFLDIIQTTKGHVLVATKDPFKDIFDVPEDVLAHLFGVCGRLAKAIKAAFSPLGLNVLSNNGEAAGQKVFHFHLHLVPRYEGDDVSITLKNHVHETPQADYQKRADAIVLALGSV
jgi:histidine triad (HIT) family protein